MGETYIDSDGMALNVVRYKSSEVVYLNLGHQYHRLDGPAIERANGHKEWCQNNKNHRLDGPAVEYADGDKEWFIEGKKVEPLFLVAYWLERGRCCWYDETTQTLCFSDP